MGPSGLERGFLQFFDHQISVWGESKPYDGLVFRVLTHSPASCCGGVSWIRRLAFKKGLAMVRITSSYAQVWRGPQPVA